MHLIIIEPNAHNPGHYTEELFQFCKHIIKYFEKISVITPFGFKEEWDDISNCEVFKLLNDPISNNSYLERSFHLLYGYQWEFFRCARRFINSLHFREAIVHVWDYKSFFPVWFFLNNCKYQLIINLKTVHREQVAFGGSKFIGNIQGRISKKLISRLGDKYIVHTPTVLTEAIQIGIPKRKIYNVGIGVEENFKALDKLYSRKELNLPIHSFIILFFGVIREEKGIYEILDHIKSIPENIILFIVGENHLANSLDKIINAHKLQNKVITKLLYIPEKELEIYFRASDAVLICHQRKFKGESGVFLKAIQYEIPTIADLESHSAKIIESDKVGALFDMLKPGDILIAIEFIKKNLTNIQYNLTELKKKKSWDVVTLIYNKIYFE